MKKTTKSPENVEVTPSKKKLKQARLPFMLLSDVSPKTESPPTRKRKLSAPDLVPVTKVGKLSKENSTTEELVVISDEESKVHSSPQKQDKVPNPYVRLVDTARKKKLQKNKTIKKSKSRSSKSKTTTSENDTPKENNHDSECDEVEMMEVDVEIHEDCDGPANNLTNGEVAQTNEKNDIPTEKTRNNSNVEGVRKSESSSGSSENADKETSHKNDAQKSPQTKTTHIVSDIEGVVCIDDSNSCSDVKMPSPSKSEHETPTNIEDDNTDSNGPKEQSSIEKSETTSKNDKETKSQINILTPRRSPRKKSKNNEIAENKPLHSDVKADKKLELNSKTEDSAQHEKADCVSLSSDDEAKSNESLKKTDEEKSESETKSSENGSPKRSVRIKDKDESSLNMSTTSSKLDQSMTSNPSTPKNNKSLSENSQLDKSLNESVKNLTPKQLQKKLEAAKKKEDREKEKQEREKKRQQEKEEREKQRKEKEDQKKREREEKEEAKRREREEKEEQRKKEKEEREKQKELERKAKEEKEEQRRKEKEDKEEQRRKEKEAREEEKRKRQEALELEKQEQELKKKKAAEAFVNFFVPKQKVDKDQNQETGPISKNSMLSSFTVKVDMRLAPATRVELSDDKKANLDKFLQEQDSKENLYLKGLKSGVKPLSSGKTWPLDDKDEDCMVVEDELPPIDVAGEVITCESAPREKLRPKLLSFHDNRRPPYWGTWRKTSARVKPRRPFGQDEKLLDYEVESDDDWEDEADGESLDGSAGGSDDEAGNDDYELDNEVFVPHGYLSDEEATMDEEDGDVLSLSPETQKARLKHLEDEFELELKKPTERLKPRLYGLLWENSEGGKPDNCVDALWNYFEKFAIIMDDVTPLLQPLPQPEEPEKKKVKKKKTVPEGEKNEQSPKSEKKKKVKAENKDKKPKQEVKKPVPNQPGINNFLKKRVNPTQID